MLSPVALLPLLALLTPSLASTLDFSAEFAVVTSSSVTPSTGTYLIQNAATGSYLYFARDGQVGAYLGSVKSGVHIEEQTYEGVTGVIIKGTTPETLKCLASQWNFDYKLTKRARNEFAVPYQCRLGSDGVGTYGDDPYGNDSNKQFWLLNAVKQPFVSASVQASVGQGTKVEAPVAVNLNAVTSKKTNSKAVEFVAQKDDAAESTSPATPSAETSAAAPAETTAVEKQAFDKNDRTTWDCQHDGKWLARHENNYIVILGHVECISVLKAYKESLGSSSSDDSSASSSDAPDPKPKVDKNDQRTWVCQHDGKWLARHEKDYIETLGHVECIDDLKAYKASLNRKMAKRTREQLHAAVARRSLQQRAIQTYFTIHPINHLDDMQTLALSSETGFGFADMPAVILAIADDSDKSQWWSIVAI